MQLVQHELQHGICQTHKCNECKMAFSSQMKLETHMAEVHDQEGLFKVSQFR